MSHATRRRTALLLACALTAIASLSAVVAAAEANRYPPRVERAFVSTCTRTAKAVAGGRLTSTQARRACRSALRCIEGKLTLKRFVAYARRAQSGRRNRDARPVNRCIRSAARDVGIS